VSARAIVRGSAAARLLRLLAVALAAAAVGAAPRAAAAAAAAAESAAASQGPAARGGREGDGEARLDGRLDSLTRQAVQRVIDAARRDGLPTEPLVSKALEGATKRAPGPRIVAVVQTLAAALREARATLGGGAAETEIVAGAGALQAGMRPAALARLRAARPNRPLTMPLVVLADLVTRGVPADTAAAAVLTLSQHGATDADFIVLRRDVERDIVAGAPPAAAAALRARGFPLPARSAPGTADLPPTRSPPPPPSSRGSPP